MKIDRSKVKKSSSEVPLDCRNLIDKLKGCSREEFLAELKKIETWTYGKCELYHWIDILDLCDDILETATKRQPAGSWLLECDRPGEENRRLKELVLWTLHFTTLLIEHSFSRHFYSSMEHLSLLLSSFDLDVVLAVLNLLYMFSKRSNFISRLAPDKRQLLLNRLSYLAASWGGKDNGFGLSKCCSDEPISSFPPSATTLHFEFYAEVPTEGEKKSSQSSVVTIIHMEGLDKLNKTPAEIMEELLAQYPVPEEKEMLLYTYVRLANGFSHYPTRLKSVQARLQALSVLIYSNQLTDSIQGLLYSGLLEELVELLEMKGDHLMEIKAAALKSLTSIIHLDRNPNFPKLNTIIDVTGAASFHGFLPVMVRNCITSLTSLAAGSSCSSSNSFPQPLATALFSFLYHLASYEAGGEALVSCGMMESLLKVIQWPSSELEHITFVTRAVRVIDLITNLDMASFQLHAGLNIFIRRLQQEVDHCRKQQPYEIQAGSRQDRLAFAMELAETLNDAAILEAQDQASAAAENMDIDTATAAGSETAESSAAASLPKPVSGVTCLPQRAALLKSMLNFLKKAIQDPAFSDSIRHVMDGSLPASLKHVISNAEYYGPSLFLLATDVVTAYVFQEPSLLSSLQDKGLTDVVLHALLVKEVPATREVLASLPNVFSALCLNARGLEAFVACRPFERLFQVLLSPDYLPAMRRRRSADPLGDTASNLGNAMDELMRHQPSLKQAATAAIIKLLEQVCALGRDPKYVCWKSTGKGEGALASGAAGSGQEAVRGGAGGGGGEASSDEEEEEEDDGGGQREDNGEPPIEAVSVAEVLGGGEEKEPVPLVDYVLNVMKFVDAILSNNSTDDHCREFVNQKGLVPLMGILGLPNLPVDFPAQPACQSVAAVCKSILNLAHEPQVLKQGLLHLNDVLKQLEPLHTPVAAPGSSVLLRELVSAPSLAEATCNPAATPLLHSMAAAHAYITMFVHVCRTGQADIRTISISHWGSELGLQVLGSLAKLYTSLVWESTVLLALCSEDTLPPGCQFGRADMDRLLPIGGGVTVSSGVTALPPDTSAFPAAQPASPASGSGVTTAMEQLTTESSDSLMDTASSSALPIADSSAESTPVVTTSKKNGVSVTNPQLQAQIKQIKPLLSGSSRLGRALAELFGLLVKLCVGSPLRQRRGQQVPPAPAMPSPPARAVATALTKLLTNGLSWEPPPTSPLPKFRLTFLICSVGFTSPMLFDEKKYPYHLMLMKFLASGGQQAFFRAFYWAITLGHTVEPEAGLESQELPEGTGEFLDAWLLLLEKMVNPRHVLESPHLLPAKASANFRPFDALRYLIKTHKAAFEAVMHIWGKRPLAVYGSRMAESVLTILCHILKGEVIIKERLEKERPAAAEEHQKREGGAEPAEAASANPEAAAVGGGSSAEQTWASSTPAEPDMNPEHLQTLMDMGFPRERCVEAMQMVGGNLDAATDYLLNNPLPPSLLQQQQPGGSNSFVQDDLMRAIAMSLGDNVMVGAAPDSGGGSTGMAAASSSESVGESSLEVPVDAEDLLPTGEQEALKQQVIDTFTNSALSGCLTLLDTLPETVYRVTDLLMAMFQRNGAAFKESLLSDLMAEVKRSVSELLAIAHGAGNTAANLAACAESRRAAVRIHLFTLLFEDCSRLCVRLVENTDTMQNMVRLIAATQEALSVGGKGQEAPATPKWVTPMLLFIDLYEKVVLSMKRRAAMAPLVNRVWKWFDISSGKWCPYGPQQNKAIDDAFWAGEQGVKITSGRRKYNIQFGPMIQSNEETGNKRPVMISLKEKTEDKESQEASMDTEQTDQNRQDKKESLEELAGGAKGLDNLSCVTLLRACVSLIAVPVEPDALNAIMRLCLRLTRSWELAAMFADLGGIRLLLALTQSSSFSGFSSLASLLVRHVLEDEATLRHTMEKVIRAATISNNAATTKELHYLLRYLAPAACRNPAMFTEVGRELLRVDMSLLSKRGEPEEDPRLLLKSLPAKAASTAPPLREVSRVVISDLLNFLVVAPSPADNSQDTQPRTEDLEQALGEGELPVSVVSILGGRGVAAAEQPAPLPHPPPEKKEEKTKQEPEKWSRPLLPKSAVCRLLAEMVKSYAGCARLITEHMYTAGMSELVKEDCSALAFILDELLTLSSDADCSSLVKMLVAAIAGCNHAPEAQTSIVTEVKNALMRALSLPECNDKHTKIQSLTGLISTMIESCPMNPASSLLPPFKQPPVNMNNIVKCMLKKGLITDLARVPHALDLSSPNMAASINAALKPLETLSKIVNQPSSLPPAKPAKAKPETTEQEAGNANTNTTNSEATRAQGDEQAGAENEATEHDVSTAASVDPNSESGALHTVEEADTEDFDEMIDQLLERDGGGEPVILADVTAISTRNDRSNMDTDDLHDESGVEEDRRGEGGEDTEVISEVISDSDSSRSQDTEGSGDEGEEDMGDGEEEEEDEEEDDEEDEDDEEEEEDDDGGSEVYDDDQEDDYQDMEDAAFYRVPNLEREFEPVMMIGLGDHHHDPLGGEERGGSSLPLWGESEPNGVVDIAASLGGVGGGGVTGGAVSSHVTPSHPLLMGRAAAGSSEANGGVAGAGSAGASRTQNRSTALQRHRGFRYIQLNPRTAGGVTGGAPSGTPAILQSLLGGTNTRDILALTGAGTGMRDARVLVMDNAFAIFDGLDDELPGVGLDSGMLSSLGGGLSGGVVASALNTVPTALVRWTEESRVLDGDSVHDCVTAIKPQLLEVVEKQRDEEFVERRERRRKQQEEEEEVRRKKEEERQAREPHIAAGSESSQTGGGNSTSAADEMDVVVSENASTVSAAIAGGVVENSRHSISDTVSRLTQDLANAIGGRVSGGGGVGGPTASQLAGLAAAEQMSGASGLLSSLSELLPSGSGAAAASATSGAATTLNSVLQSLSASYHNHQSGGAGFQETSTPIVSGEGMPPTFHFSTPPPPFSSPIRFASAPAATVETAVINSGAVNSEVETPSSLPDALGPLSPSPDQETSGTINVGAVNASSEQQQQEEADVSMTSVSEEADIEAQEAVGKKPAAAQQPPIVVTSEEQLPESVQEEYVEEEPEVEAAVSGEAQVVQNTVVGESAPAEEGAVAAASAPAPRTEPDFSDILGNIEIPEGVDPSFLAALPEDMRQEVLEEQRRLARARHQPAPPQPLLAAHQSGLMAEVNPEFLAALPPNIQEEVLAQQRLEQQRQNAARIDPAAPVDPGEFLQNLPPSLRQSLLADMEESQISALPAELAAEAQTLRRDFEQRNRAIMHERFFNHVNSHAGQTLSSILRSTVNRINGHYAIHHTTGGGGGGGPGRSVWTRTIGGRGSAGHQHSAAVMAAANSAKFKGRQLLDHEGLSCLLILLFIDDAKLNTTRLHRILRNLCYHAPTRDWVVRCLLSILEKANACSPDSAAAHLMLAADPAASSSAATPPPVKMKRFANKVSAGNSSAVSAAGNNSWLNISMDAALGFRANVFQVMRPGNSGSGTGIAGGGGKKSSHVIHASSIHVHPQAAPVVCKHTLELLISLAKSFPIHFLPPRELRDETSPGTSIGGESSRTPVKGTNNKQPEFWDTLLKLDRECWSSRKGKSVVRSHSGAGAASGAGGTGTSHRPDHHEDEAAGQGGSSAFGQLLSMLASPVIRRSSLLTDKLLRLLSLISLGQPDVLRRLDEAEKERNGVTGNTFNLPASADSGSNISIDKTVREDQIQLAVEVLTSKACSEEGLEDVTALLLNLSYGGCRTHEAILRLLLAGARELGHVVSGHVSALLKELADIKAAGGLPNTAAAAMPEEEEMSRQRGVLADRFTKEAVVLTAPAKPKAGGGELQLSSMSALTNKTSSQSFFLRVLKVIIQLREAALLAIKKMLKAKKEAEYRLEALKSIQNSLNREREAKQVAEGAAAAEGGGESGEASASSSQVPMDVDESSQSEATVISGKETPVPEEPAATSALEAVNAATAAAIAANSLPGTSKQQMMDVESLESLSDQLDLQQLWDTLSACLRELADTPDHHAVLVLQPTVEAFFLVHAAVTSSQERKRPNQKETRQEQLAHIQEERLTEAAAVAAEAPALPPDTRKFLEFAETHRTVLNQILRQSTTHLADGPFAVLVDHTRVLDFDIKRKYFRTELERLDEGMRREDLAVHVRRDAVFEESFRELHRRSAEEWKNRFYIVFEGEEGQDAGGLLREWYVIISREIFNPNYALFKSSPGDRVTYTINDFSHINSNHLDYFKFVGRVIAKAIYDNKLLECYFTRSFYKHILAKAVKHQDMESEDYEFYKGLEFLLEHKVTDLGYDLTFSTEIQEFGVTEIRDLIPDGRHIAVTEDNKHDYVRLVCQMKMTGAIRKQLSAFLEGFYDIIPRRLISIFNEQELELLLSGLPDINIEDLKANTEYHKYSVTSLQIVWFWRALRSFDQTDRAKFLQFVTGSSKVPLQGFGALEGMNGAQKFQIHRDDRSTDRLPAAHTCFNQLDLPAYETYDKLRNYLLKAIQECSEGFGFA